MRMWKWPILVLVAWFAGGSLPARAAPLDHFLCYTVKTSKGTPKFQAPPSIALKGQIGDEFEEGNFDVKKPVVLCVPAQKNNEPIRDPYIHLKGYQIKPSRGTASHVPQTNILVENQFGAITIDTIAPDRLLVPSLKSLESPPSPPDPATHNVDHFKGYKVRLTRGTKFPKGLQAFMVDQFDQGKLYNIIKTTRFYVPVAKGEEEIKNPQGRLMCYAIKPAKGQLKHQKVLRIQVNNQFGPEVLDTIKEEELCVPPPDRPPDAVETRPLRRRTRPSSSPCSPTTPTPTSICSRWPASRRVVTARSRLIPIAR